MEYLLLASTLLFLPGLAISYLLSLDKYRYLISFSLSYSLFVFLFKATSFAGLDAEAFSYIYFLLVSMLLMLALAKLYRGRKKRPDSCHYPCVGCNDYSKYIPLFIIISLALYFFWAGAYVEVPADVLRHLEFIKYANQNILLSEQSNTPIFGFIGVNGKFWHYLYSFQAAWSGMSLQDAISPASYFNVIVFLLGVFCFSNVVFRDIKNSSRLLAFVSLATVFFTFFHFGINIFSFIRYYALAPVILNFMLYFTVMAIVIDFFRDEGWDFKYLFVAGIVFSASIYIHIQEAMLAALMISIMSFYLFVQKHLNSLKLFWLGQGESIQISPVKIFSDKINLSFLLTQTIMVSLFIYSYFSITRNPVSQPKIISLENILPFFKNLYILNPGFQFYNVVTVWGIAVILLYILNYKKFRNNTFLMAGMLSPFFTVFNPFFTDLFLRHSLSEMFWRMSFLLPIHLVAGYIFVSAINYLWIGSYLKKAYGAVTIVLLVTLLFPFQTTFIENQYSRLLTLKPVPVENSPGHWNDMISYLNGIESRKLIITDPITGYLVTALTQHWSPRSKFHHSGNIEFNFDDYSNHPFDGYKGNLFIINKRNGGLSETGRVARHWPEKILQLEDFYSSSTLEDYVSANPDRFRLLWEKDMIRIYSLDVPDR